MNAFLVVLHRSGPDYVHGQPSEEQSAWAEHAAFMDGLVAEGFVLLGGPMADEHRVVLAVEAADEEDVRRRLGQDPWSRTHLEVASVLPWRLRMRAPGL